MEQQPSNGKPRSHRIAKVLFALGIAFLALGLLSVAFGVLVLTNMAGGMPLGEAEKLEWLYRVPLFVLLYFAAGMVCMGLAKVIRILEEIRARA